jgi:hypothetical protein
MSAISRAMVEPRSSTTPLTAQDIRALMRNDEWIKSWNTQLVFVEQFAKTKHGATFDTLFLAELFELTHSRV